MTRRTLGAALLVLLAVAGCRRNVTSSDTAGARNPQEAVVQFLDAARAQDLDAIAAVWGNAESPVRERISRQELERRLLIMTCHLKHDESRVGPAQQGEGGRLTYTVELTQGTKQGSVPFTVIRNSRTDRWFVEDVDLRPVQTFCTRPATRPPTRN